MKMSEKFSALRTSCVALLSLATLAGTSLSQAQTTPAAPANPSNEKEDVFTLNPFVVVAEENTGYQATSTLAGSRINTNLRDLGAAISVITPEFLADTGATSIDELLVYTTGTEVGGAFGNFSAAGLTDGAGRPDQDASRREPQSGARVRGFATPNYTRGYFSSSLPVDAYNIGSITFSRGANSLLFGLGSAGGVIDSSTHTAMLNKSKGSVSYRFGSNNSSRATLDYNLALVPNRLAVRLNLLHKDDKYQQDPAFDRQNRVYVALNAVVFENKNSPILGKTSIRGSFEAGEGTRNPPASFAPSLAWGPFFSPPPNFQPYTGQDYPLGGGYALLTANWRQWAVNNNRRTPTSANASGFLPGWFESLEGATAAGVPSLVAQNHSSSHIFEQVGLVYNGSGGATIGVPGSNLQGFQGWLNQQPGQNSFTNPFINTRAYQEGAQSIGFKVPSLRNTNVFDYKNQLITGSLQEINTRFDDQTVTIEQMFFRNRLGVEATLNKQFYHIDYYQPYGGNNRNVPIYIDTSLYLDDTTLNPNVGRAFMLQQGDTDFWRNTKRDNRRVTAFYDLDFKDINDGLGKWLGRHTFTGLWQKESVETKGLDHAMHWSGASFDFNAQVLGQTSAGGLSNRTAWGNQVVMFSYLSPDLRGVDEANVRLTAMNTPRLKDGDTFNSSYYDGVARVYKTGTIVANRLANGGNAGQTDVTSKALAWQPRLLNNHIVGLVGWREDKIENFRQLVTNARGGQNQYLPSNLALNSIPATMQEGRTFTWSVVGHLPKSVVERLPLGISSASVHYGKGENFAAISERRNSQNQPIPNPQGTTTEAGITIGFNGDKFLLKINNFESNSLNAGVSGAFVGNSITEPTRALNNYISAESGGLAFTSLPSFPALSAAGYTSYEQLYTALKNLIPTEIRALYDYQKNTGANAWQLPNGGGIQGLAGVQDVVATGTEIEIVANLKPNWRLAFNAAKVNATPSNSLAETAAIQAAYVANLNSSRLANIVEGPASITTMLGRYTQENLNAVVVLRAKDGSANQELREYRLNLITNYDFREGRFKGFGVGGALRWQSEVTIGYKAQLNANNAQVLLLDQPYTGPAGFNGDIWFSYSRKLTDRIHWEAKLNVRNAIGSRDDIPVAADPDGFHSLLRIAPERAWYLTNTFSF